MVIVDVILDTLVQSVNCRYHVQAIVLILNMVYVNWMGNVNVMMDFLVILVEEIKRLQINYQQMMDVWMNVIIMVNAITKLDYVLVIMDLVVLIVH